MTCNLLVERYPDKEESYPDKTERYPVERGTLSRRTPQGKLLVAFGAVLYSPRRDDLQPLQFRASCGQRLP